MTFQSSHPSSRRRRTHSFSSSSSSSSSSSRASYYFPDDDSPVTLVSPMRSFSGGIPFSWEHLPGIPKNQSSNNQSTSSDLTLLLPLPPINSTTPPTSKRFNFQEWRKINKQPNSQRDPFFDAFIECSKDGADDEKAELWNNSAGNGKAAVSRSLSDRFGFLNLNTSCKRTCGVSESIVYLPRTARTSLDLLNHRRGR